MKTPTYTALVVEDYKAERLLVKKQLHRLAFHVVEAADGQSAELKLAESHLDLICLDLMLPDVSGLQLCESIRNSSRHGDVPILVLSGRALPEDRAEAHRAGASGYLVKPFGWEEFNAEVRRLLALKRTPRG
jgi:DNA-binding response OmpR family regulator